MQVDNLYHLGISTNTTNILEVFGDVKFVCVSGSCERVRKFAARLAEEAGKSILLENLAANGGRFSLYKVGAVIVASHGMGNPSISILISELVKLLRHAQCDDVTFIRLGTCGGIGVTPGSLVLSTACLNGEQKPHYETVILGEKVLRETCIDGGVLTELQSVAKTVGLEEWIVLGKTMCADGFYEEQGRSDGAFCTFTKEQKHAFLQKAYKDGVRNIEMESICFSALCHLAKFPAAVVCVALINRLEGDQITIKHEDYESFEDLPGTLVIGLLKKHNALY